MSVSKRPREEDEQSVASDTSAFDGARAAASAAASAAAAAREKKFEGRHMPESFPDLLGEGGRALPDEAKDIEDVVHGHLEFSDLPEQRRHALLGAVKRLHEKVVKLAKDAKQRLERQQQHSTAADPTTCDSAEGGPDQRQQNAGTSSPAAANAQGHDESWIEKELERLVMKHSRLQGAGTTAKKSELTAAYRQLVREGTLIPNPLLEQMLIRKRGKSHSGVLVITVFMGPGQFSCPKDCHYCPNQPGIARSYLLKEPGVLRGFRNQWDPISQFYDRASALENNGHVVDKIELIILGGTFSFYPKQYVEEFMQASFYAANTYYDTAPLRQMQPLQDEITRNETARCRVIGVTAETRPDYISNSELRRFRSLGITRVQLGIQHLDDDILTLINRECPTAKTVVAIQRLLDAGFKVDAHWMPDLPGSSYAKDREMFELLLSADNESFQVDQWKVYPTAVVPYTTIQKWYEEGRYKPYAELDGGRWMVELLIYIMEHCPERIRLNRIIRDIPTTYIMGGEKRCNLRQVIEAEMKAKGIRCRDIRERECKGAPINRAAAKLFVDKFRASGGTEYYISLENEQRTSLFGHLRLRLRDDSSMANSIVPCLEGAALVRELHTYGRLVAVNRTNTGKEAQHVGVGTELMKKAEDIAREHRFSRTAVIAGVGVRKYYEKLGYRLQDTYMVKDLEDAHSVVITDDLVAADDDNERLSADGGSEGAGSFLQAVSQTVALVSGAARAVGGFFSGLTTRASDTSA